MRGVYIVRQAISSLAAAKTVLLGTSPSTCVLELLEAYLTQRGQQTGEQVGIGLFLVTTLGSPTGTSITASNVQKTEQGTSNTGVTWLGDLTAEPTTYNANPLSVEGVWNIAGYRFEPAPEGRIIIPPSTSFGLRLLDTPSNAWTKAEALIKYREVG